MVILFYEFITVVFTAIFILLLAVGITYYVLTLLSIITGLLGLYNLSLWFTIKADNLSTNIKKTFNIIMRNKS